MRGIKRILAFVLSLVLSVNLLLTDYVAYAYGVGNSMSDAEVNSTLIDEYVNPMDDMSITATDSFGTMLQSELDDVTEEQEANEGYNVFSVEMIDNVAVVELETMEDCTLVVGIYDETSGQMLASGSLDVYKDETEVYVDISIDTMPEYYYVRANLVAFDTLQPLCEEYESSMYTKEMQELLAMTTDDFDSERVLNFDNDMTNNFAVYSEDTIVVPSEEGANDVTSVDEENNTYVIENANDYIKSLVAGDIFAYEYNDGENKVLLVKVKSITLDGNTATIIGEDTSMEEVFDYVKIDEETDTSEIEVDSECEDGVVYNGMVQAESDVPSTYGFGYDESVNFALNYEFFQKPIVGDEEDDNNVMITGDVEVSFDFSFKLYISLTKQYLEFKLDYTFGANIEITGKISMFKVPLSQIRISPIPSIVLIGTPYYVGSAEGSVNFIGEFKGTAGFSLTNKGAKNLTKAPKLRTEISLEGKLFFGFSFEPSVCIINKRFASVTFEITKGLEISGELVLHETPEEDEPDEKHECSKCIEGEIRNASEIKYEINVLNIKALKFSSSKRWSKLITDFYFSIDKNEEGFGKCPYNVYRITVEVIDENEKGLSGVTVFDDYVTGDDGKITFYLPNGSYDAKPTKDGYIYLPTMLGKTKVKNKAKNLTFLMVPENGGSGVKEPTHTEDIVIDEATFPNAEFRQYVLVNFDTDGNGLLSKSEIDVITDINLSYMRVNDLTGVNLFYNLEYLNCNGNEMSSLNLLGCSELKYLYCSVNNITSLDLSGCTQLIELDCTHNLLLTELDLSWCPKLKYLNCDSSNIINLDLLGCSQLIELDCHNNNITVLDLSDCSKLIELDCDDNNITSLNLSNCSELQYLTCDRNKIAKLDVLSCSKLNDLTCDENNISSLNLSDCFELENLSCYGNNLVKLDLSCCSKLQDLNCFNNNLTGLAVSGCSVLTYLRCDENNLTSVDVTGCSSLDYLICDEDVEVIGYDVEIETYPLNNTETSLQGSSQECGNSDTGGIDALQNNKTPLLTYQSTATPFVNTIHQVTLADDNHVDYADLYPNEIYNFYVVKESADDIPYGDVLTSDNLLYIKQYTTDENGTLSIDYIPSLEYENATEILVCYKRIDISEGYEVSILDLPYTGNEQAPTIELKVGGVLLTEGQDYELEGDYYVTDIGEYIVIISGIGKYEGSIDVPFKVKKYAVESIVLNPANIQVKVGNAISIKATVSPSYAYNKTLNWTSSNTGVASVDSKGKVTALKAGTATITATATDGSGISASCTVTVTASTTEEPMPDTPKSYPTINTSYRTHIQSFGWEGNASDIKTWKSNGTMSGTSGKAKRLEGINIVVNSADAGKDVDLGIQYTTHCQSYGWLPWSADGDMNGTEGEAKRLEAIKIQLTGADKDAYDVYYRVHAQSYGWLNWAKNGAPSGTAGYGKRLEGIQIVVVKKGESFNQKMEGIASVRTESYIAKEGSSPIVNYAPTSNTNPVIPGADTPNVAYRTHVQSFGWQGWKYNGQMSGTSGLAKRLEGININLTNKPCDGDIVYTTHVQTYGWKDGKPEDTTRASWKKNGAMSGTSGEAKRLEAICIDLTGEMGEKYDIYYRVHAQSFGWLGWAKNGEESGTAGYAKRLEGIQIVLVPKGGAAPANDYGGVTSVRTEGYIAK